MARYEREKGAAFEREIAHELESLRQRLAERLSGRAEHIFNGTVWRNLKQYQSANQCDMHLGPLAIECKRRARIGNLYEWLGQAESGTEPGEIPVVIARADREEPVVILYLKDLEKLLTLLL
jgi:hypothetical protein